MIFLNQKIIQIYWKYARPLIFPFFIFFFSFLIYLSICHQDLAFWDSSEYLICILELKNSHPPGNPLFLFFFNVISLLLPADKIIFFFNLSSGFFLSLSACLIYFISIVILNKQENDNESLAATSAAISSLIFSFLISVLRASTSLEVYPSSLFLSLAIVLLSVKAYYEKDEIKASRIILLSVYIASLSASVHFLSGLSSFFIGYLIALTKDNYNQKKFFIKSAIYLLGLALIILTTIVFENYSSTGTSENDLLPLIVIASLAFSFFYLIFFFKESFYRSTPLSLFFSGMLFLILILFFELIFPKFILLLKLEIDITTYFLLFALSLCVIIFAIAKPYFMPKGFAFILLTIMFISKTIWIIPPIASLKVSEFYPAELNNSLEFAKYLSRAQYGDIPLIKRNYGKSNEPTENILARYPNDAVYFLSHQLYDYCLKYFLENYFGISDNIIRRGTFTIIILFLPGILFIFGIFVFFKKDAKLSFLFVLALIISTTGVAFYHNPGLIQARDKDYFFLFGFALTNIFISISLFYTIKKILSIKSDKIFSVTLLFFLIFIPFGILIKNYEYCDNSDDKTPLCFACDFLNSLDSNSICFVYGDNDFYPLLAAQKIRNFRKDVKIVSANLLNLRQYSRSLQNKNIRFTKSLYDPDYVIAEQSMFKLLNANKSFLPIDALKFLDFQKQISISDIRIIDIIENNKNAPIYFSSFSGYNKIPINKDYLRLEGFVYKFERLKVEDKINFEKIKNSFHENSLLMQNFKANLLNEPVNYKIYSTIAELILNAAEYYLYSNQPATSEKIFAVYKKTFYSSKIFFENLNYERYLKINEFFKAR